MSSRSLLPPVLVGAPGVASPLEVGDTWVRFDLATAVAGHI
jgi:hypothetical protein